MCSAPTTPASSAGTSGAAATSATGQVQGGGPGAPRGCWGVPPRGDPAVPQGWDVTGPGTASPCRTGVTPWTPRWRLSASSSTSRASGRPSSESLPLGHPLHLPCSPFSSRQRPVPLLLSTGKSTGSCWSRSTPRTAPGVKAGLGWGGLGVPRGQWWFGGDPRGAVGSHCPSSLPQTLPCPRG